MNKLTHKDFNGNYYSYTTQGNYIEGCFTRENQEWFYGNVVNKLGELEDIEEELGIDLITLFKILKSKEVIYKRKRGVLYHETTLEKYIILGLAFGDEYYGLWVYDKFGDEMLLYTKDYGKTWALTREELENGK